MTNAVLAEPATEDPRIAREHHPRAIRWMHWINFPILMVMIWSGLRIYWANDVYALTIAGRTIFPFFPESVYEPLNLNSKLAKGLAFHFTFGWFFTLNGIAYVLYLATSGQWRHLVPDRFALKESTAVVLHDLHLRGEAPAQGRYNAAQRLSYSIIVVLGGVVVATGLAMFKPAQLHLLTSLFGGYETARAIHFGTTLAFMAFFGVHVAQVIKSGWSNFASMVTGYKVTGHKVTGHKVTEHKVTEHKVTASEERG